MRRIACLLFLTLVPSGFSVAEAQGMAELAAKEKAKRKAQKTGKVYDEYELKRSGQGVPAYVPADTTATTAASPAPPTAAAAPGAKAKTAEELQAEAEKAWREKLQKATQEVQTLGQLVESLQKNLNDTTGNIYSAQRTNQMAQLEQAKTDLAAAQQRLADLQEEGRRSRYR